MPNTSHSKLLPVASGWLQIHSVSLIDDRHGQAVTQSKSNIKFSLIVPTYNESDNIEKIIQVLSSLLNATLPKDYELIVVDDNSPDRIWQIAQELLTDYPDLRVMRRQHERGLSTAVIRASQVATGEVLGVIDGDLQHRPEVLYKLLAEIDDGADIAVASRHMEGGGVSTWSLPRRI